MSRGPRQTSRINSPPRSIFIKLDLGISPPRLNRFSRFQRRCNPLIHTFPTVYNMTQYIRKRCLELLGLRKLRKLLEAQGAMGASRPYREVIVSARARCHYTVKVNVC